MITGREPNIVARMENSSPIKAKALRRTNAEIARREIDEQKSFYAWLRKQRKADRLCFLWPRSDKATTIQVGHPDFSIWLKGGRTLLLEFKAPFGQLSPEQQQTKELFDRLEHLYLVVHTARQAIDIVEFHLRSQIS